MDNQTQDQKWEEAAFLEELGRGTPVENIFIKPEKYSLTNYSRLLAARRIAENSERAAANALYQKQRPNETSRGIPLLNTLSDRPIVQDTINRAQ